MVLLRHLTRDLGGVTTTVSQDELCQEIKTKVYQRMETAQYSLWSGIVSDATEGVSCRQVGGIIYRERYLDILAVEAQWL